MGPEILRDDRRQAFGEKVAFPLFHSGRRRHPVLGMLTPTEHEDRHLATRNAA